jgi:hypothetical protein
MIKVVFKNLDPSELARNIVIERLEAIRTKFPDLEEHSMTITLVCENSSQQPGPDLFNVRLLINGPRYKMADGLLERLNQYGDKARVRGRQVGRKLALIQGGGLTPD